MWTKQDVTLTFRSEGEITIPKGTKLTSQTACGVDTDYHFVDEFDWYKPELKGFAREMALMDMVHYGINIPIEYVSGFKVYKVVRATINQIKL